MFDSFMQMGAGAAFFLIAVCASVTIMSCTAVINRTVRQGKRLDTEIKRQEVAATARQIEHKH